MDDALELTNFSCRSRSSSGGPGNVRNQGRKEAALKCDDNFLKILLRLRSRWR